MKKLISLLAAVMLLLCACAQGSGDDNTVRRGKKDAFSPSGQKVESSIFGRNIKYDSFTPAENISLPIESSEITDMLQIGKSLYFLTDGAVYTLDIESGVSDKLFDTIATMFASYGDTLYTYAPESGKLCAYSADGEIVSEAVLELQNEELVVEDIFVTDDYYCFKCEDKSGAIYVKQYNAFDRQTLEHVNIVSEKTEFSVPFRAYCSYKGNSLLKLEDSTIYEIDLEAGKSSKLVRINVDYMYTISALAYNPKTDTVVLFTAPKRLYHSIIEDDMLI